MKETNGLDLSVKKNATQSMNKTAMIGMYIMNAIITAAYVPEILKGARTVASYLIVAALCIVPCVLSSAAYKHKKDAVSVRYILGIGFMLMYTYVMFTSTTDITFCYVVVAQVVLVVYIDLRFLAGLGGYALLVNIIRTVMKLVAGELKGEALTNAEIIVACLALTILFMILTIKKISAINEANIDKAAAQKEQSEQLLQTTLQVADSMTGNISEAVGETEGLKDAIGMTQKAMEELTACANEEAAAIEAQKQSTDNINQHIHGVEKAVDSIVSEVNSAEENLNAGSAIMQELLKQVKISEASNAQVAEKMTELRQCVDQMQAIMSLISNVANQTGLLALNASIEAARAGEAGRGFAVVASEISSLSAQTNAATGDINNLIDNIVKSVTDVTESMEQLLESSRMQNEHVDDTAANFEKIHGSTQNIISQVTDLKKTVDVVTYENQLVKESIENVFEVMERVMAGADETLESCNVNLESIERVAELMDNLKEDASKLQN